jgi:DNA-binding NarL/FixJ family response regulator
LLVDDEALVRETLAPYLGERLHVEMRTASSGEEALEQLRNDTFDVVLADHAMPGMTGLALLCRLREEYPTVARVMVTGQRNSGLRDAAVELGAVHAFVPKPYSLRRMVKLLRALIDHQPASAGRGRPVAGTLLPGGPL